MLVGPNYLRQAQNWVRRYDHNHLRITRIIRSLRVLGLEQEAQVFFHACESIAKSSGNRDRPSDRSVLFWTRAAIRPLNIAPGVDDRNISEDMGPAFLKEYERMKSTSDLEGVGEVDKDRSRDLIMREDNGSGLSTPKRRNNPKAAAKSEESTPEKLVVEKKQSRLDAFFKRKGKKTKEGAIDGRAAAPSHDEVMTSDVRDDVHGDDESAKDTAQDVSQGNREETVKSVESSKPEVAKNTKQMDSPSLKRKAEES